MAPARFRVDQTIKGKTNKLDGSLLVGTSRSSCGLVFTKGQTWLVFASGSPLNSDAPSNSMLLITEAGDIQQNNADLAFRLYGWKPSQN